MLSLPRLRSNLSQFVLIRFAPTSLFLSVVLTAIGCQTQSAEKSTEEDINPKSSRVESNVKQKAAQVRQHEAEQEGSAGAVWSGISGGIALGWNGTSLEAREGARVTFRDRLDLADVSGCTEAVQDTEVLSWVGPYLSLHRSFSGDCGGAHPVCSTSLQTYELYEGEAAAITSVFAESQVLAALQNDPYLRDTYLTPFAIQLGTGPEAVGFEALGKRLLQAGVVLEPSAFYFHHLEGKQVAVRVVLFPLAHATCGDKTELGLLLSIPPSLRSEALAAQNGHAGFFRRGRPKRASYRTSLN